MSTWSNPACCAVAAATLSLLAVACGNEQANPTRATAEGAEATASVPATAARTVTPETPTTSPDGGVRDCMIGTWELGAEQVDNPFEGSPLAAMPEFAFAATGRGLIEFAADGTYHYVPDFHADIQLTDVSATADWSGTLDGTWTLAGSTLTMSQTDNQLVLDLQMMGHPMAPPPVQAFDGVGTVTACEPMTLTYEVDGPGGPIAYTLVFAG